MRTLNKMEIKALASKITKEINMEIKETQDAILAKYKAEFYKTKIGKAVKILENSPIYISLQTNHYAKGYKYNFGVNVSDVESEIILTQIESDNLSDIIKSVKSKFNENK